MGTFLLLCMMAVAAMLVIGVIGAIVGTLLRVVFWVVTLPVRIFFKLVFGVFKLVFGLGGLLLGLLFAPFLLVIAAIGVVVALVGAVLSLLTPMLPVLLLGLFAWAVYRLGARRPAAPPPQPGFWS